MELLRLLSASLLILSVGGVSNGNLPICSVDMAIGAGTNVMKWVKAPVDSSMYLLTAGGAATYRPGGLTPITLTVTDLDFIYIGLLLVAEGVVNTTAVNVGQWTILDGDDFFLPATCKFAAVAHKNANLKAITHTFYWKGEVGMGTVTFRALIKQGEQNHGNFYRPVNLVLTEGAPIGAQTVWKSAPGASCDETCGQKGMACDQTATLALTTPTLLQAKVKDYYACRLPLLKTCAPPATGADSYCYFTSCSAAQTFVPVATCSRRSSDPIMDQQFCACKAGNAIRDPQPPVLDLEAANYGLRLAAPMQLDAELTLNSLEIVDSIVTVDLSGPQDRWFAIGWDASFMNGAYATVVWLNSPQIRPPQNYFGISDKGYQDGVEGWYDARCQQALNDYCRNVGGAPNIYFSCAIANTTAQWTNPYVVTDTNTFSATLTSRVPCKAGKLAPYLPMTVGEYRLKESPRGFTALPSTITPVRTLVDAGQFRIVFSRNVSGPNPFPNRRSMPIIWSMGVQQYFGNPLGSTSPIKHYKKSETVVTVNLVPIYPVCAISSSVTTLPSMLLLGGLVASLGGSKNWVLGALLALLVRPTAAHNWLNLPSRAQIAAVSVPCQTRVDPAPHLQVGPGQTFQLEWSTGHGETPTNAAYWVFLKEEAYNNLVDLTDSTLEDYLNKAPAGNVLVGDQWTRRHLSPFKNYSPGCVNCNNGSQYPAIFEAMLTSADARFVTRNPISVKKSLQWWHDDVRQFWYPAATTNGDKRAQYHSDKYPWIISVHKFGIPAHWPDEYDLATFSFPNVVEPGNYIAHWKWGGYRDCTDVNIQAQATVSNPWGLVQSANLSATFARLEHCEFTNVLNPSTNCRVMTGANASQCLTDCLKLDGTFGCTGVQAVLKTNPAGTLPYTPNFPYKKYTRIQSAFDVFPPLEIGPCDSRTIHKRRTCPDIEPMCDDTAIAGPADSYICYGLTPYRDQDFQVAEDYVISTDPRDPGFYSTCWVRLAPGGFLPYPPPATPAPVWRVGEQCLSCDWLANTLPTFPKSSSAPPWGLGLTTDCRDCSTALASGCNADATFVEGGGLGTCATQISNGGTCSALCANGFALFGAPRVCENGILTGTEQKCSFSGC
jgi:hypothetical protein